MFFLFAMVGKERLVQSTLLPCCLRIFHADENVADLE